MKHVRRTLCGNGFADKHLIQIRLGPLCRSALEFADAIRRTTGLAPSASDIVYEIYVTYGGLDEKYNFESCVSAQRDRAAGIMFNRFKLAFEYSCKNRIIRRLRCCMFMGGDRGALHNSS
jgi:hypothetical protein